MTDWFGGRGQGKWLVVVAGGLGKWDSWLTNSGNAVVQWYGDVVAWDFPVKPNWLTSLMVLECGGGVSLQLINLYWGVSLQLISLCGGVSLQLISLCGGVYTPIN